MGKVRQIRTQALWVQEVRATGRPSYKKVLGSRNPSDVLTKHVAPTWLDHHLVTTGAEFRGGRADSAPALDEIHTNDGKRKGRPTRILKTKLKWPKSMSEKGDA